MQEWGDGWLTGRTLSTLSSYNPQPPPVLYLVCLGDSDGLNVRLETTSGRLSRHEDWEHDPINAFEVAFLREVVFWPDMDRRIRNRDISYRLTKLENGRKLC